jgi:hypothetical protein
LAEDHSVIQEKLAEGLDSGRPFVYN